GGATAFANKANLKFNGAAGSDLTAGVIAGTLTGTLEGDNVFASKTAKVNIPNMLVGANGNFASLSGGVAQSSKRLVFAGNNATGNGTVTSGTYKLPAKGIGRAKGSSETSNGNLVSDTKNFAGGTKAG